jgi:hypothetical protein
VLDTESRADTGVRPSTWLFFFVTSSDKLPQIFAGIELNRYIIEETPDIKPVFLERSLTSYARSSRRSRQSHQDKT